MQRVMPLDDFPFDRTVVTQSNKPGRQRFVGSVRGAAECLVFDWPTAKRGRAFLVALEACVAALDEPGTIEATRLAFVAAAKEAKVLVREGKTRT